MYHLPRGSSTGSRTAPSRRTPPTSPTRWRWRRCTSTRCCSCTCWPAPTGSTGWCRWSPTSWPPSRSPRRRASSAATGGRSSSPGCSPSRCPRRCSRRAAPTTTCSPGRSARASSSCSWPGRARRRTSGMPPSPGWPPGWPSSPRGPCSSPSALPWSRWRSLVAAREVRAGRWRRLTGAVVLAAAVAVAVAGPFLGRNAELTGSALGSDPDQQLIVDPTLEVTAANTVRHLAGNFRIGDGEPGIETAVAEVALRAGWRAFDATGVAADDQRYAMGFELDAFELVDHTRHQRTSEYGANPSTPCSPSPWSPTTALGAWPTAGRRRAGRPLGAVVPGRPGRRARRRAGRHGRAAALADVRHPLPDRAALGVRRPRRPRSWPGGAGPVAGVLLGLRGAGVLPMAFANTERPLRRRRPDDPRRAVAVARTLRAPRRGRSVGRRVRRRRPKLAASRLRAPRPRQPDPVRVPALGGARPLRLGGHHRLGRRHQRHRNLGRSGLRALCGAHRERGGPARAPVANEVLE